MIGAILLIIGVIAFLNGAWIIGIILIAFGASSLPEGDQQENHRRDDWFG